MLKNIILLFLFIFTELAFASLNVEWSCPRKSTRKTNIKISFDTSGNVVFSPDIFTGTMSTGSVVELTACIYEFQKLMSESITDFKKTKCPSSGDSICFATVAYFNSRIVDKLQQSYLVKNSSGVVVNSLPILNRPTNVTTLPRLLSPSEKIPESESNAENFLISKVQSNEINLKNTNQSFMFENKSYKVADFPKVIADNLNRTFEGLSSDERKQYAQNYLLHNHAILKSKSSEQRDPVVKNLELMFKEIYGDRSSEELAKVLECAPEDNLMPIADILKHVGITKKTSECSELTPGQHKVFEHKQTPPKDYYSTGDYLLKRKKDGSYEVTLSVDFVKATGSVSPEAMLGRSKTYTNSRKISVFVRWEF